MSSLLDQKLKPFTSEVATALTIKGGLIDFEQTFAALRHDIAELRQPHRAEEILTQLHHLDVRLLSFERHMNDLRKEVKSRGNSPTSVITRTKLRPFADLGPDHLDEDYSQYATARTSSTHVRTCEKRTAPPGEAVDDGREKDAGEPPTSVPTVDKIIAPQKE